MRAQLATGLLLLVLAGCGGGGPGDDDTGNPTGPNPSNPTNPNPTNPDPPDPNPPGPGDPTDGANVAVNDNEFVPGNVTIKTGTAVVWTWTPGNYSVHSVTFADNVGSSQAISTGTHSRTFATAGSYAYQCSVHGSAMSGTVIVADP